jgi:hypothetical protein
LSDQGPENVVVNVKLYAVPMFPDGRMPFPEVGFVIEFGTTAIVNWR